MRPASPVRRRSHPLRWLLRLGVVAAVALAWALLLRYDVELMRLRHRLMPSHAEYGEGTLDQVIVGFRNFAQLLTVIVVMILVAAYDPGRRKRVLGAILIAQLLTLLAYNSIKYCVVRDRPSTVGSTVESLQGLGWRSSWHGTASGNRDEATRSFPSGHSAAAFALAFVLACYYRRLRWLWWLLAIGAAASRFLDGVHWASDCLAGAALGLLCAGLVLAVQRGWLR